MEKRCFRMGVTYYIKKTKNCNLSNKDIKTNFFNTYSFFGELSNTLNINLKTHIIGNRKNYSVINSEHYIEFLKQIIKFLGYLSKIKGKILFINSHMTNTFDGIIKTISLRSGESFYIGKWKSGILTKKIKKLPYKAIFLIDPNKNVFLKKEAQRMGIPIIGLCGTNSNTLELMFPIPLNNSNGASLIGICLLLSNCILENKLTTYLKGQLLMPQLKKKLLRTSTNKH